MVEKDRRSGTIFSLLVYCRKGRGSTSIVYNEIACVEKDRQTLYHTFECLALIDRVNDYWAKGPNNSNDTDLEYYVSVVAEDRNGNIIAESTNRKLTPLTINGG